MCAFFMQINYRYAQHNRLQKFPSEILNLPRLQEMYILLYNSFKLVYMFINGINMLSINYFKLDLTYIAWLHCSYLDSNNISGVLILPNIFTSNSSLRLISLINNNITMVLPSNDSSSLLSASNLQRLELLFLGGNPVCKNLQSNAMMQVMCRFNRISPLEGKHIQLQCQYYI
jgi:hypothetical protein